MINSIQSQIFRTEFQKFSKQTYKMQTEIHLRP